MKGSIRKRGNFHPAPAAISRKKRWSKRTQAENESKTHSNDRFKEIRQIAQQVIPQTKFKELAEVWLKSYAEINLKQSTLARYRDIIKRLFIPAWGHVHLSRLTAYHIHTLMAERLKSVSPKTVANEIGLAKEILGYARRWGFVQTDPSEAIKRPRSVRAEIEILNPEEINRLLAKTDRRYRLAFLTAVLSGMRAGELWALQWPDIDFETFQIHVRRSLWRGQFQTPKSKSSVRRIDIPERLVQELKKLKLASKTNGHDLVFPNGRGNPTCHDNVVKRQFEPALQRAGLKKVSFHSLRHTNASMRISAGQNIKYIQNQLGHSSINITLDIYGHLFNDANFNRQQVKLLEASLDSAKIPIGRPPFQIPSAASVHPPSGLNP